MARESKYAERTHKAEVGAPGYDWAQAALEMALTESEDLGELAVAAQLNPIGGDLSDIDLSNLDLTGQDMSGWDLWNAKFDNAKLAKASLKNAVVNPMALAQAVDWEKAELSRELRDDTRLAKLLIQSIQNFEMSVRSETCLINANITRLGDLVQKTEYELLHIPNFGRKSLNEIKEILSSQSLTLGMEIPWWKANNVPEGSVLAVDENAESLLVTAREMSRHGLREEDILDQLRLQIGERDWPFKVKLNEGHLELRSNGKSWRAFLE